MAKDPLKMEREAESKEEKRLAKEALRMERAFDASESARAAKERREEHAAEKSARAEQKELGRVLKTAQNRENENTSKKIKKQAAWQLQSEEKAAKKQARLNARARQSADGEAQVQTTDPDEREWYKIDNAGLIFIPSRNRNWSNQFRFACVLDVPVRPEILQQATNDLYHRFPTMMVYLKAGLFWNYFESAPRPPAVEREEDAPCRPFDVKARSYLMRILYSGSRVSVEFFHGITDGKGGIVYFMSLIRRYLELCGEKIPPCTVCMDYRDIPSDGEKEDAFTRHALKGKHKAWTEEQSAQLVTQRIERGAYNVTHAVMSASCVKEKAREYGATVSEYLAACLVWTLRSRYLATRTKKSPHPLKLCVPVDLRRLRPSETLRNFVLMYNIEHYPETPATFDDVMNEVKSQFREITSEYVQQFINKNVATAESFFIRILPRPIKSLGLNIAYRKFALKQSAMSFSNLGVLDLPEELALHLRRVEFVQGPGKKRGIKAACVTVGDQLVLSFGADCVRHGVESAFLKLLTSHGVELTVDTNRRECNV